MVGVIHKEQRKKTMGLVIGSCGFFFVIFIVVVGEEFRLLWNLVYNGEGVTLIICEMFYSTPILQEAPAQCQLMKDIAKFIMIFVSPSKEPVLTRLLLVRALSIMAVTNSQSQSKRLVIQSTLLKLNLTR